MAGALRSRGRPGVKTEWNLVNMVLATVAMVLGGILIGTACAFAVPESFMTEVSLAVGIALLIAVLLIKSREKEQVPLPNDKRKVVTRQSTLDSCSDTDSESQSTQGSQDIAEELLEPSNDAVSPDALKVPSPPPALDVEHQPSLHERVQQEKRRLSLQGRDAPGEVKATALSLSFQDVLGRSIRYSLRTSKKKERKTYLQLSVDGEKPKKIRNISIYDRTSEFLIHDGKEEVPVTPDKIEVIVKRLMLLSKIGNVKLDCASGSPALTNLLPTQEVKQSLKKVSSCGNLTQTIAETSETLVRESLGASSKMRKVLSSNGLSQMGQLQ